MSLDHRPVALVTGASRRIGIGAAICRQLAADGFDIAFTHWTPYDKRMAWGSNPGEVDQLVTELTDAGAAVLATEADFEDVLVPDQVFAAIRAALGSVDTLVSVHCESVDSSILDTTVESWDRHFAVNARANWLLIKAFAEQFEGERGRIVAITSDAIVHNLPYGSSKGALDRIVVAAANELRGSGITANLINPGGNDTGWMSDEIRAKVVDWTLGGRLGTPQDCANLVSFLCSEAGAWVNGQLLYSDGGISRG